MWRNIVIPSLLFYLLATSAFAKADSETESSSDLYSLASNSAFSNPNAFCDIIVEHGVCLYKGEKCIFPSARPNGLVTHLSFDDNAGLDDSGCMNNAQGSYASGPSMGGNGYSAAFNGSNYLTIPNSHWFDSPTFSMTFWLFLTSEIYEDPLSSSGLRYCPIVAKGTEDDNSGVYERSPSIYLDREQRTLTVFVSTTSTKFPEGEYVTSNAIIPYQKWTHVAFVRVGQKMRLYVNGIMDSVNSTAGTTQTNQQPLYIGNTPWTSGQCAVPMFFDEFRFYTNELSDNQIQAEAAPALGYIQPNFVILGCINCGLQEAAQTCIVGYHLCTNIEIHSAGYQVARAQGWASWSTNIWTYNALNTTAGADGKVGLGLCCLN